MCAKLEMDLVPLLDYVRGLRSRAKRSVSQRPLGR